MERGCEPSRVVWEHLTWQAEREEKCFSEQDTQLIDGPSLESVHWQKMEPNIGCFCSWWPPNLSTCRIFSPWAKLRGTYAVCNFATASWRSHPVKGSDLGRGRGQFLETVWVLIPACDHRVPGPNACWFRMRSLQASCVQNGRRLSLGLSSNAGYQPNCTSQSSDSIVIDKLPKLDCGSCFSAASTFDPFPLVLSNKPARWHWEVADLPGRHFCLASNAWCCLTNQRLRLHALTLRKSQLTQDLPSNMNVTQARSDPLDHILSPDPSYHLLGLMVVSPQYAQIYLWFADWLLGEHTGGVLAETLVRRTWQDEGASNSPAILNPFSKFLGLSRSFKDVAGFANQDALEEIWWFVDLSRSCQHWLESTTGLAFS